MTKAQEKKLLDKIEELQGEVKALRRELAEKTISVPVPYPVYVGYPYQTWPYYGPLVCDGLATSTGGAVGAVGSLDNYTISIGPAEGGDTTGNIVPSVF